MIGSRVVSTVLLLFLLLGDAQFIFPGLSFFAVPTAQALTYSAVKVESFDQNVTTDGSTFTLATDVGATSSAFIRMSGGTRKTSAGPTGSTGNTSPNVGTVGLRLTDTTTVTVERVDSTQVKVMGEVWRYEGEVGDTNEFIVRDRVVVSLTGASQATAISGMTDVDRVVPFITGYTVNASTVNDWEDATIAAHMDDSGNLVVSRNNSGTAATVYVDVVEFTGSDWTVCHGYSNAHDTTEQTITLNTDSDGQGGSTCDVTDWGTATIIEATMEGDSSETGISDTLALVRPGVNTTSVVFDLQQDANARDDGQAWIHVLQNDALVVNRNSDADIAEGNGTYNTATWPVGATTTAAIDTLALEWFTDSSGVGTAHMRGGLHARITDPSGTINHWIHRSGNTVGVEYGVVELSGLTSTFNDVFVSATSTQIVSTEAPATNLYAGGAFVIQEQSSSRNLTSIAISESGTINGSSGLENIKLFYDLDTTGADGYDCSSESYSGTEAQFGSTDTNGFSGADGISSFSDSVTISTTQSMCVYVVYDVTSSASDGETIELSIADPSVDISAAGSPEIGPPTTVALVGVTTVQNAELTQIHYNWREDDGNETGATSVDGVEDTPAGGFQAGTPRRLRIEVSTEGSATSPDVQYRLQYGEKAGTCSAVSTWTDVAEDGGAWESYDSTFVTNGGNTTNIAEAIGGVTDEEVTFYGTGAQIDGGDKSGSIGLAADAFVELEYTIIPTSAATEGTTYCFRVVDEIPTATHGYRVPLTIQSSQVASTLTNFPVYVDLATLGNHFFSNVRSDGGDIRVTTSDGVTEVPREVVSINTSGGTGELHFLAPSVSSSADTTFYIYYGASGELDYHASSTYGGSSVWSNGYSGVYHLLETGSTYFDSTINANHGIGEATDPSLTTGKIGGGQSFAANGRIDLGTGPSVDLNAAGEYYVSTWLNLNTSSGDQSPVSQYTGAGDFLFWADTAGGGTGFCHYNGSYLPSDCQDLNNQSVGNWQYVVAYHTGSAAGVYLNGTETGAGPTTNTVAVDPAQRFAIGAANGDSTSRYFNGLIDEVRISTVDFGLNWSAAEFTNQDSPVTFYATSSFQALSASPAPIVYATYPEASINADIFVTASSSQVATLDSGSTGQYVGGTFVIERAGGDRTLTDITITETGTVDAQTNLDNIEIWYDLSATDCTGESYTGTGETQFGATDTDGFSAPNGSSTFSGSQVLNATQTFCGYVLLDVGVGAINGQTIDIEITNPSVDVVVTASSVGPSSITSPTASTTIVGPIRTQTHYHWRNDDGDETDTGATSATNGQEDQVFEDVPKESTIRLRMQVSNESAVATQPTTYRLEYGTKISDCSLVGTWSQVGVGASFATSASAFISDGNTTDVDTFGRGAMTEENTTLDGVGALRETSSESGAITLSSTEYTELEFAIEATAASGYETNYCFRVTDAGTPLEVYTVYPELITRQKQDFFIQRGTATITGTSLTINAGASYTAPYATSTAFVRISDAHMTGAGDNIGTNGQQADDVTAYISDQSDVTSSFTISRPSSATSNTRVNWEIIEFVGLPGTDNEIKVRGVGEVAFTSAEFTDSGATTDTVTDDGDIAVFITGQQNQDQGTSNYNDGLFTAAWNSSNSQPDFTRGDADVNADVSYAVVEFTGANWKVQRLEHTYTAAGVVETETMEAVTGIPRTFVHAQKRVGEGLSSIDEGGHLVYVSSVGAVSFELRNTAETPADHVSVAWVIENTQTGTGAMTSYQSAGSLNDPDPEPGLYSVYIGSTVHVSNASIWGVNHTSGTGTTYPRLQTGFTIASSTHYEIFRSDTNNDMDYRVEVVEWPVADTSIRQNYYRFYVDNDALDPTDPHPVGASDLGENFAITGADDPLGEGDRVRIRMTLLINNASLAEQTTSFKLQYGRQDTTCSAIASWSDLGDPLSGSVWRGFNTSVTDGVELATSSPAAGRLNISISDVAGTFEEQNSSAVNPYSIDLGENVEYDWAVEHNGATQLSDYCFRMVKSDDSLLDGYNNYPTIRTTGYTPVVGNWRWYDDSDTLTPATALAAENTAPVNLENQNAIKLRVTAAEVEGAPGSNVKFALQFSEQVDFSDGGTYVAATSSCLANSLWCYVDGAGVDGATIPTATLSDVDSCVAGVGNGCGTHNEAATTTSTHGQASLSSAEYEFTLKSAGPRVGAVYYFRLYDVTNDVSVSASSSYPSIIAGNSSMTFTVAGLPASTVTEGVTLDVASASTSISFGSLLFDTEQEAAHRLTVDTNATDGYQILMFTDQEPTNTYGGTIQSVSGTNATPIGWLSGCTSGQTGCVGYHVGDDLLIGGSARFGADDSYAEFSTTPQEIMYSSVPTNESHDIVYKIQVGEEQPAGEYQNNITYIAVPVF